MLKDQRRGAFLTGAVLGAAVWVLSPLVIGRSEPWDADGMLVLLGMLFLVAYSLLALLGAAAGRAIRRVRARRRS
ncbi:MAG TPA: hypothetical protein VFY42_05420 [Gemmatimonadales bacterium]|nr:hypothetical protein [Gemmatimonadales bacterium]